jgi:hypothetical protein
VPKRRVSRSSRFRRTPNIQKAIAAAVTKALAAYGGAQPVPGVVVGVWLPGKGAFTKGFGYSNIATHSPIALDDHFRIGSNTKTSPSAMSFCDRLPRFLGSFRSVSPTYRKVSPGDTLGERGADSRAGRRQLGFDSTRFSRVLDRGTTRRLQRCFTST